MHLGRDLLGREAVCQELQTVEFTVGQRIRVLPSDSSKDALCDVGVENRAAVGDITMTIDTYDYLNDSTFEDTETETVAAVDSGAIDFRVSGRYIGMTLSCGSLGSYFRFGKPVAFIKPSGRR